MNVYLYDKNGRLLYRIYVPPEKTDEAFPLLQNYYDGGAGVIGTAKALVALYSPKPKKPKPRQTSAPKKEQETSRNFGL
jgi:hypothetical protein